MNVDVIEIDQALRRIQCLEIPFLLILVLNLFDGPPDSYFAHKPGTMCVYSYSKRHFWGRF